MNTSTNTYHLSHIDLDGYSCQLITNELFQSIDFFNSNYGLEVMERLETILELIDDSDEAAFILITDLNLTLKESKFLDEAVKKRNEKNHKVSLLLLDHHGSGQESADVFDWYRLDTTRSATKITYDYALEHWRLSSDLALWLAPYVDIVNAVDLWKMEEEANFEYGKVCMRLVTETRELNRFIFDTYDRSYKFALLKEAASMSQIQNAPIVLDEKIHAMKKAFFTINQDNTLDGLATAYVVNLIGKLQDELMINFRGHKGILTYALGNTSIIGNGILKAHPQFDFVIDIGMRGTMSLRADNKIDVSVLAKELAGGGGHPNASGGRLKEFKEQYNYKKVKDFIESLLSKIESHSKIPLKD